MAALFRKNIFMLDEIFQGRNTIKFAIILEYENPCVFFRFSFRATLFFFPNEFRDFCGYGRIVLSTMFFKSEFRCSRKREELF